LLRRSSQKRSMFFFSEEKHVLTVRVGQ